MLIKLLHFKFLLFVPIRAFYIFVVNCILPSFYFNETHTFLNVNGLCVYDKSFLFEERRNFMVCRHVSLTN
jgi:hypothetical protein